MSKKIEIFTEPIAIKELQEEGAHAGYFKGKGLLAIGEGSSVAGYIAKEKLGGGERVVGAMVVRMDSNYQVEVKAATVNPQLKEDRIQATVGALVGAAVGFEQFLGLSVEVDSGRRKVISGEVGRALGLDTNGLLDLQEAA